MKTFDLKKALFADERKDDLLYKSANNIHGAQATPPNELNAEQLLKDEMAVEIVSEGLPAEN